ncbi:apolipoprotein N-acyltransferase [Pedococcus dokdonensis]|uniref:Apolipoprotein N-acyltransferase n=1 Tax=Pedococcus dokdonensis TaxID=443156 RepID=A0A1H0U7L9_9MICO|nr:apolipoprotein N-acyltransferase [Pedococcus dokdonensis]SDP62292.1 apolipoprotein N-acyltransferase [Pedococcus dokdonensis]
MRAVAAAAAGVGLDLAFPGVGWWPAAPLALAGLFVLLRGVRPAVGALVGGLFGLGFFVPHLGWSGIYVGPGPWLALAALQAAYIAGFGVAVALLGRVGPQRTGQLMLMAPLWVAQEAARARTPFGGFPWGRVAFSQADSPALGWAWAGGAPVVSFVVASTGALLAVAAFEMRDRRGRAHVTKNPATPLAAVVGSALLMAGGALLPLGAGGDGEPSRSVSVAAVQGNVARPGLDFNAERRQVLANHHAGTLALAADVRAGRVPAPDVVLWPENSSDIDPTRDRLAARDITAAAEAVGVPVVVGAVLAEPAPRVSNATLVWSPLGEVTDSYVKRRPVPFAEYVPYRSFFRTVTTQVDLVRTDFAAGKGAPVINAGPVRFGVAICFEVAFDDQLRDAVRQGAGVLLVPTNNATFGRTDESLQQLAMSRLRAVELGRSVVHISTVGVSALIRPDGSVTSSGGHFTAEVLSATLPVSTALTPAARLGAWPETLIGAAGFAVPGLVMARNRTARRRRRR